MTQTTIEMILKNMFDTILVQRDKDLWERFAKEVNVSSVHFRPLPNKILF